jgi:hypothetical protein
LVITAPNPGSGIRKFPMTRFSIAAFMLTTTLISPAFAGPDGTIDKIEVTVDMTAITNPAAAARYAHIGDDLQSALMARLVDRIAETGMTLSVDISEVELSNTYTEIVGSADTRLVGTVNITDMENNSNYRSYELSVDINQAKAFLPTTVDLSTLSASSNEYYKAMIATFADTVAQKLSE